MTALCHRCHHAIPTESRFCPECGAPQLRLGPQPGLEETPGEAQPRHTGDIVWPAALRSAALIAIPTGVLLAVLAVPVLDMFWVVGGTVWTLRRYKSRAPAAPVLTPQTGGRIGLLLGLFAAAISAMVEAASLVVERFGLHHGSAIDSPLQQQVQEAFGRINSMKTEGAADLPALYHFWLSPEGQGALVLISAATSVLSVLFFAWLGGRFAVRYGWVRRPRA